MGRQGQGTTYRLRYYPAPLRCRHNPDLWSCVAERNIRSRGARSSLAVRECILVLCVSSLSTRFIVCHILDEVREKQTALGRPQTPRGVVCYMLLKRVRLSLHEEWRSATLYACG